MAERMILCGPVHADNLPSCDRRPLRLSLWHPGRNVHLCIEDVLRGLYGDVPAVFRDLIDIATYVYAADQAISRGSGTDQGCGASWQRQLFFRFPVRCPARWRTADVTAELVRTLSFLTEDEYDFQFEPLVQEPPFQSYFTLGEDLAAGEVEEVVLFSGGIDSLGGAVQEAVVDRRPVLLVHHRSTPKLAPRHRELVRLLRQKAGRRPPWHAAVRINKAESLGREFTQRSRSFLFLALTAGLAVMAGRNRVRFYENGVVSINLPPSAQVVGARASRTTHPRVLCGYQNLLSLLRGEPFTVENPFRSKTKADVVELIAQAGCAELIRWSTSCSHTRQVTTEHSHCGVCSQCIDRRFAVLAAGQSAADPAQGYRLDLVTGPRDQGHPRTMLAVYLETANQLGRMGLGTFFSRYGEATRVLYHIEGSCDAAAAEVYRLYRRHAGQVNGVVEQAIAAHVRALRERTLPESCLIRLVTDSGGGEVSATLSVLPDAPCTIDLSENVFRRHGRGWQVRFAGRKDFLLLPSKGAAYLHQLLSNPGRTFSVVELAYAVARNPCHYALGDAGEVLDREALTTYRARLQALEVEYEESRRDNDELVLRELEAEREMILDQIRQAVGRGGRPRRAADDRDRVRQAIRANIRRAIKEIDESDPKLAQHLSAPQLRCSWDPCYTPDPGREWET